MKPLAEVRGVAIRAVRSDDRERILKAFRGLEPRSVHQRFFFGKKEIGDEELRRLTEPQHECEAVLVAAVGSGAQESIVGLGHYVRIGSRAEIAFIVEEDYQGGGIATELLRQLVRIGRDSEIEQFEADVLADNLPMLSVLRRSGLTLRERQEDGTVHVTLYLKDGVPDIE
jgi:RimJ/RimL family protein N-acetyltransferase